uniref:Uncharacterized protein n=1 Tax=Oryza meridionalis TaxID=40149 RepID=A0A0E0EUY7_9ORYZ
MEYSVGIFLQSRRQEWGPTCQRLTGGGKAWGPACQWEMEERDSWGPAVSGLEEVFFLLSPARLGPGAARRRAVAAGRGEASGGQGRWRQTPARLRRRRRRWKARLGSASSSCSRFARLGAARYRGGGARLRGRWPGEAAVTSGGAPAATEALGGAAQRLERRYREQNEREKRRERWQEMVMVWEEGARAASLL